MARIHHQKLSKQPTLAELRAFVDNTRDLPDTARITVRIGFGGGGRLGSRPTEITAAEQDDTKT